MRGDRTLAEAIRLRHSLHAHPDLSGCEAGTAQRIARHLADCRPDQVVTSLGVSQTGLCAVFKGQQPGPTVMLRCELDALPIAERNAFAHRSTVTGVSHKCGHDGHMAILAAVADGLCATPPASGRVLLLFQPAEETGSGARSVLGDPAFRALGLPDFAYALHNVPHFALGEVLVRRGTFAQGSAGFRVHFGGRTSHASYPEHGVSPAAAVAELVTTVNAFNRGFAGPGRAPVLGTITFAQIGRGETGPNYGIAPGEATITGVLRAQRNDDLDALRDELESLVGRLAADAGLTQDLSWHECFTATGSDDEGVDNVVRAAGAAGLPVRELGEPFRWSEDFGRFTAEFRGAFFGLGAGVDQPQLHDQDYDFPDELIEIGARLYRALVDQHLG